MQTAPGWTTTSRLARLPSSYRKASLRTREDLAAIDELAALLLEPLVAATLVVHAASPTSAAAASASPAPSAAAKNSGSSAIDRPMWLAEDRSPRTRRAAPPAARSRARSPQASRSCRRTGIVSRRPRHRHAHGPEQQPQHGLGVMAEPAVARPRVGARQPRREQGREAQRERRVRRVERGHPAVPERVAEPRIPGPGPAIAASQPERPAAASSAPTTLIASCSPP